MNILELRNIGKQFPGSTDWAVKDFNLTIEKGEITALLGESGCGKTTVLRMIAGFETPTSGCIYLNGECVSDDKTFIEPQHRQVGIVFQDYALFPHKTVWENIIFGLFRLSAEEVKQKAVKIIRICGLEGLEKRYPHQLSGGQKQRVALARAMAPEPRIILFDEPFSNIDSKMKTQMREDIRQIIHKTQATAVFVTHDTKDVMAIADKVSVMKQGIALQIGKPEDIYKYPVNAYVADFFGKTNLMMARVSEKGFITPMGLIEVDNIEAEPNKMVTVSIRPEQLKVLPEGKGHMVGKIIKERFFGEYKELTCIVEDHENNKTEIIIYASPGYQCTSNKCYFEPNNNSLNILND